MPRLLLQFVTLLRGNAQEAWESIHQDQQRWLLFSTGCMVTGAALYGATIGIWRSPLQAIYTAIKLPLLVLLTCLCNALLNGMTAQLLGLKVRFAESALLIATSFAVLAIVLGSLSPITFFLAFNAPPVETPEGRVSYNLMLVTHVLLISYAGVVGNHRLLQLLTLLGNRNTARAVLISWLAANLFLGAQISWILRPMVGSPTLPTEFLRDHPMRGNFYEAVLSAIHYLFRQLIR